MSNYEHLRIPGGPTTPADDRRELRRVARMDAGPSELYLRDLMGDDEYEYRDND